MKTKEDNLECTFIRNNLFSYLENELSPQEKSRFEFHLGNCAGCSRIIEEFRIIHSLIDSGKSFEPDPYAGSRVLARIERELEREEQPFSPRVKRILKPVLFSLAIVLAVWIGFSIGKYPEIPVNRSQADIQQLKTDMHIADFTNEDRTFLVNP